MPLALILPLRLGMPTYFLPRFRLADFTGAVDRFAITDVSVVPPIICSLSSLPQPDRPLLRSLRHLICAGAPMTAMAQSQLYDTLHGSAVISQCWGTTETGWITLFSGQEKDYSGSVGRLLSSVRLKVDLSPASLFSNESSPGEGLIQSPSMFSGYLHDMEASTAAFDSEGFYRTGDLVYLQAGKVFYAGRIKETFKVNGWQVSPTEIENVISHHPLISDVAVAGMTFEDDGGFVDTLIRAYVVRRRPDGLDAKPDLPDVAEREEPWLTASQVEDFVKPRLVSYKHLTGGVIFVTEIPRSSTGKILRGLLEQAVVDYRGQEMHDEDAMVQKE